MYADFMLKTVTDIVCFVLSLTLSIIVCFSYFKRLHQLVFWLLLILLKKLLLLRA